MKDKRYSILQTKANFDNRICIICGKPNAEIHEAIFGTGRREKSIEYGLCICLCKEHHTGSKGVHNYRLLDLEIKRGAEREFLKTHTKEEWMEAFRKDYL